MSKIFRYECRRLLLSKFFFGLVAVTCFYGWQVLEHVTILGIAHTAPFSPWSFGDYLSRLLPLLWLGTLFSVSVYTNGAERRAAMLTQAAPMHPAVYRLARFLCVLTASALLSLAAVFTAVCFYARMFRWHDWGTLVFPALVTLAPALLFAAGGGWLLGHMRVWLLVPWALFPLLPAALLLPEALGLWNGKLFSTRPLLLPSLDPAFSLLPETIVMQCALALAGAGLFFWAALKK